VWCGKSRKTLGAFVEVQDVDTNEKFIIATGTNVFKVPEKAEEEKSEQVEEKVEEASTFYKVEYDHNSLKFASLSIFSKHIYGLSTEGKLYGWGSNKYCVLGKPAGVESLSKPTLIEFFDRPDIKILEVIAGDKHSLVQVLQTFADGY
jgi:alpha-tubulin suppressor-like RCC1 family protein